MGLIFLRADFCGYRYYRYNKRYRWPVDVSPAAVAWLGGRIERMPRVRISLTGIAFLVRYLARLLWLACLLSLFRRAPRKAGRKTIVFFEMP